MLLQFAALDEEQLEEDTAVVHTFPAILAPRPPAAKKLTGEARASSLSSLRRYYAEVDAFELAEEVA